MQPTAIASRVQKGEWACGGIASFKKNAVSVMSSAKPARSSRATGSKRDHERHDREADDFPGAAQKSPHGTLPERVQGR